jgi:hypothetical protein
MPFDSDVYATATADGIPAALALLIVAQSKHETNNYTSAVFLDCNNAFGYGSTSNPCQYHEQYQGYNNIVESTHELTAWIKRRLAEGNFPALQTITTPEQYAQLLNDNGYYTDTVANYAAGLARWFSNNIGMLAGVSITGIAAALLIFYFLFKKELHIYKK